MKQNTTKVLLAIVSVLLVCVLLVQVLYVSGVFRAKALPAETQQGQMDAAPGMLLHRDGYTLEQVVVLSRHNIRSPMSGKGSALDTLTPYEWFSWSSNPSQLSIRGGVLETEMGQYFRKWMESEGLIPENWLPEEVRSVSTRTRSSARLRPRSSSARGFSLPPIRRSSITVNLTRWIPFSRRS